MQSQVQSRPQPDASSPRERPPRKKGAAIAVAVVAVLLVAAGAGAILLAGAGGDADTSGTGASTTTAAAEATTTAAPPTSVPVTAPPSEEVVAEATSTGDVQIDDVYVDADGQVVVTGTATASAEDLAVTVVNNSGVVTTVPVAVTDVGGGRFLLNVDWKGVDLTEVFGAGTGERPKIGAGRGAGGLAGSRLEIGSGSDPVAERATVSFAAARPGAGAATGSAGAGSGPGGGGGVLGGRN